MGSIVSLLSGAGFLPEPEQKPVILASRASTLAQIQTNAVLDTIRSLNPTNEFAASFMTTEGDKNQAQALYLLGGKSLWTKELEVALLEGDVDILVHCVKDVPTTLPPGCELGAILEREDPVDVLVVKKGLPYKSLADLPDGSVVGTSSVRRVAQLRKSFPKLEFKDIRGNLNTRLAKLDAPTGPYVAIILAKAGLVRLGFDSRITCPVASPTLYYAVGQGALCVEVRSDDPKIKTLAASLNHWQTEWQCRAERACLRVLEGGCSVPVGVETTLVPLRGTTLGKEPERCMLTLTGTVTGLQGTPHVEHTIMEEVGSVTEAEAIGVLLARYLMDHGAKAILEDIGKDRDNRNAIANKVPAAN
ncbi:porphobilinogen deaminase [Sistotremastrum suecicum HHB10207 ss-3]|uniref:Porphobilinogen deaminase n=1 Tax=Sistotremastrum suecicum HHB10207 ss-3 TaxID=1314776 RepID=A0A166HL00_9AGAM|nr:porphobilinogen deaminase [Sistotremastrum suecicum HHB10207 ss-3]